MNQRAQNAQWRPRVHLIPRPQPRHPLATLNAGDLFGSPCTGFRGFGHVEVLARHKASGRAHEVSNHQLSWWYGGEPLKAV